MAIPNPNARVYGLATIIRNSVKIVAVIGRTLASSTFFRLTPAERAAVEALLVAIQALLELLPAPGDDSDPGTTT